MSKLLMLKGLPASGKSTYARELVAKGWEIANKVKKIDFHVLKRICDKKIKQVYISILNDSISVADQ